MNQVKKILGIVWMLLAPIVVAALLYGAYTHIGQGTKEINQAIPWIIIIVIFAPIAVGLFIFGWYSFTHVYRQLPHSSDELD